MIAAELLTPEEWAALVDQAVTMGLPGAAEAQFQLLLADAVTDETGGAGGTSPASVAAPPELPSEPEPTIPWKEVMEMVPEEEVVEVIDEDTTEGRAARYIARKQGTRPAQPRGQRRQPTLRAFDTPEDLDYQDVGEEQDEKESGPLMQNDGSITASQR